MYKILICDDEKDIVRALRIYLVADSKDYEIVEAYNGRQAVEAVKEGQIDLVIMDIMMPEMDGIEALCEIREFSDVPVILLTAKSEAEDKRMAFRLGIDDYITKPFNKIEVAARVEYQLRRNARKQETQPVPQGENVISNGPVVIRDESKTVEVDGKPVNLTPTEYSIIKFLTENAGTVFSPKEIYKQVWKTDPLGAESSVLVHIRHLREKIEIYPAQPRYIISVFGYGYKMEKMD
ncbi:MAG: response regulator transcription factor [Clostridia bacterium]|nr:response regulator transcription factor [Clostridia bacterium]